VFRLHVIAYNLIRLGNLLIPAMAEVSRPLQQGKTPEIGRSEALTCCKPARPEHDQLSGGKSAAGQAVFPQTLKRLASCSTPFGSSSH
jgi:hypothetical protein